jgi:fatty acid desaturase
MTTVTAARPRAGESSEFGPLLRVVQERGLLASRTAWYAREIALNLLAFTGIVVAVVLTGPSWQVLWFAPLAALVSARSAFIGHDAGHSQITRNRQVSRAIGLVHGNLLLGMSQAWWIDKHNRHHANPNHLEKDPDVAADVLVWTRWQAEGRTGLRGWLTRYVLFRQGRRSRAERSVEALMLLLHLGGYLALLLTSMSLVQALAFVLVHQMLFGLHLGMAFAPNHKGMEMPDGDHGKDWGHLRRQVLTSRNVRGAVVTDWLLGGLNYQIEHHLFPSMPRPHLKHARPLVRAYCADLSIPYVEAGPIDSYRQALAHMHDVGQPLRCGAATGSRRRTGGE